ncbi:signal peptidase I [Frankineae bacterium MT45]|nr:signal peptidase I [Frankineae bacterium MT45]
MPVDRIDASATSGDLSSATPGTIAEPSTGLLRAWSTRRSVLTLVAVLVFVATCAMIAARAEGLQVTYMRSGSMSPAVNIDDLVLSREVPVRTLRVGDVVTFHDNDLHGAQLTHRIAAITDQGATLQITTKGDRNAVGEVWSVRADDRVARNILNIPKVASLWTARWPMAALAVGVAAVLLGWAFFVVARRVVAGVPRGSALGVKPSRRRGGRPMRRQWLLMPSSILGVILFVGLSTMSGATYGAWTAANKSNGNSFSTTASFSLAGPTTFTCQAGVQTIDVAYPAATVSIAAAAGSGGFGSGNSSQYNSGRTVGTFGAGVANANTTNISFAVSPGQRLEIWVGCAGGNGSGTNGGAGGVGYANGGAAAGSASSAGGGGGGATAVALCATTACSSPTLLMVIGGGGGTGGGGSGSAGGDGGAACSVTTTSPLAGYGCSGNAGGGTGGGSAGTVTATNGVAAGDPGGAGSGDGTAGGGAGWVGGGGASLAYSYGGGGVGGTWISSTKTAPAGAPTLSRTYDGVKGLINGQVIVNWS